MSQRDLDLPDISDDCVKIDLQQSGSTLYRVDTSHCKRHTVLLDYDGVIVDTLGIFAEAIDLIGKELDQPTTFTADDLRSLEHMSVPAILKKARINSRLTDEFLYRLDAILFEKHESINIFPGMCEVITELSQIANLSVVSASPSALISKVLKYNRLDSCFQYIAGGNVPGSKASRISEIVQACESCVECTWMVGDTTNDIQEGQAAGVRTVAVLWGWHSQQRLQTSRPEFIVDNPQQILQLVAPENSA